MIRQTVALQMASRVLQAGETWCEGPVLQLQAVGFKTRLEQYSLDHQEVHLFRDALKLRMSRIARSTED